MKVVDLNLLLSAVNRDAGQHPRARRWLDDLLSSGDPVGLPWIVLLGFLRIATNPRVFNRPLTGDEALTVVDAWLEQPGVVALSATDAHWSTLRSLLKDESNVGSVSSDAHLAALAIEHGAELCSADTDFRRFKAVRWSNPLVSEGER